MGRDIYADIDHVLIDENQIQKRLAELAARIEQDYRDLDDLMLIGVLKGSYMFLTDLSRALKRRHTVDFMSVSSYGAGSKSSGAVRIIMDVRQPIEGRNILIVEDIIDSGHTLDYLQRNLLARNPQSLRICTLLNKPSRREAEIQVDYTGFDISDEFVVGYGLDFNESYRHFPFVAVLKRDMLGE